VARAWRLPRGLRPSLARRTLQRGTRSPHPVVGAFDARAVVSHVDRRTCSGRDFAPGGVASCAAADAHAFKPTTPPRKLSAARNPIAVRLVCEISTEAREPAFRSGR